MILLSISGCAAGSSEPKIITCPAIPTYSAADQREAAAELATAGPMLHRFVDDYAALRDQVRACRKSQ